MKVFWMNISGKKTNYVETCNVCLGEWMFSKCDVLRSMDTFKILTASKSMTDHYFVRFVRKACTDWNVLTQKMIETLSTCYAPNDHGLDLRKSGFLRTEVLKADECVCVMESGKLLGFIFLITSKRPRALYVTLMASFRKGIGSALLEFVENSLIYAHQYVALRATLKSIGFYIKNNYNVFDFISMEDYVNGSCDTKLTEELRVNLNDIRKLQCIQEIIVERDWMPKESDEFPLLKKRAGCCFHSSRK